MTPLSSSADDNRVIIIIIIINVIRSGAGHRFHVFSVLC